MPLKKSAKAAKAPVKKTAKVTASKVAASKVAKPKAKTQPPAKSVVKSAMKGAVAAISKMVTKAASKVADSKPAIKATVEKPEKTRAEKAKIDTGGTLLAMAKEEMSKVNAPIAEAAEKAEKTGKFKPIKVERGNVADEKAKWQELFKRYGKDKTVNYKMSDEFQALKPINHKVLGWGFVLTNENNRLEILFENGIKVLISNYKS